MTEHDTPASTARTQAAVGCQPNLATHLRRQIQTKTPQGLNLFVATVYGETAGVHQGSQTAWRAVASVIINRIHSGIWYRYLTSDDIIKHTGFDAFVDPKNINWNHVNFNSRHVRNHQQFLKAWATLNNQKINNHDAMTKGEVALLNNMRTALTDIYNGQTITQANYYYSPRSMHGKTPSFLVTFKKSRTI